LHTGTEQHGFLSYLIKCAIKKKKYTIFGYKGKQVRDNIHSYDLVNMFWNFYKKPRHGEIYNAGGGRDSNFSILESIDFIEKILGYEMQYKILKKNRLGDHIWWVSDNSKFKKHYPSWENKYNIKSIIKEIIKYYLQSER
jgi:CDP-paratose 2-epimerase